MKNFYYSIPTEVFFGKNQITKLAENVKKYGDRVLITYGIESAKENGLLDEVIEIFEENGIKYWELGEIRPNPRVDSVRAGVEICRENKIEFILAVGGGSTIDCSKAIAAAYYYDGDPWDLVIKKAEVGKCLPIGTVLTMSATGSEMNSGAVISNLETNQKIGFGHPNMAPKFSILDPTYSFSLPREQTAAGIADIISHTLENYFTLGDGAFLQNRMGEAILKTCIKYGPIAIKEPDNYEARANLMWAASLAINGLLSLGKDVNWSVHPLEHELSAYNDLTHGLGLAILIPRWMAYTLDDETVEKYKEYGINVWNIDKELDRYGIAKLSIERTYDFLESLGIPMTLEDVGIYEENLMEIAERAIENNGGEDIGSFRPLNKNAIFMIYSESLN